MRAGKLPIMFFYSISTIVQTEQCTIQIVESIMQPTIEIHIEWIEDAEKLKYTMTIDPVVLPNTVTAFGDRAMLLLDYFKQHVERIRKCHTHL
jgi:hypothetical protein